MSKKITLDLSRVRADIEEAMTLVERIYYRIQAYGESISIADAQPLLERYGYLFEDETLATVGQLIHQHTIDGNIEEARSWRLLKSKSSFYRGMISTIVLTLNLNQAQVNLNLILSDGTSIPYRQIQSKISNEENRSRRLEMDEKWYLADEGLNQYYKPIVDTYHYEAKSLGYPSFYEMARDLNEVDYIRLKKQMEGFLIRTKDLYHGEFDRLLSDRLGISINDVTRADFERLRRGFWLNESKLTPSSMIKIIERIFGDMGIFWGAGTSRVILDLDNRPNKVERAFCSTPRIPEEIILVCKPQGGLEDYQAFFHETGHAVHFSNIDPVLPIEYRALGAPSISEVVAFLMEGLIEEQSFLEDYLELSPEDARLFVEYDHFFKLWFLRSYSARFLFEIRLHQDQSGDLEQYRQIYVDLLTDAHQYPMKSARFLQGDYGFYSADYIMAWIVEIQLRNLLKRRFGQKWWQNPDTGKFLIENYFRHGYRYTLQELAERLGLDLYDADFLVQQFEKFFKTRI